MVSFTCHPVGSWYLKYGDARCFTCRVKTKTAAKYGLSAQPRLVDIIAAVPPQYRKVLVPKLKAKPIRTASGVSDLTHGLWVQWGRRGLRTQAHVSRVCRMFKRQSEETS